MLFNWVQVASLNCSVGYPVCVALSGSLLAACFHDSGTDFLKAPWEVSCQMLHSSFFSHSNGWTMNEDAFPVEHGDIPASYVRKYQMLRKILDVFSLTFAMTSNNARPSGCQGRSCAALNTATA